MSMVWATNFNALFKFKAFSLLAALLLNIFLMGCGGGGSSDDDTSNAQKPTITVQPASATYALGDTIAPLSVTATVTDGGTLSYQWYENTTSGAVAISGAIQQTYTPIISTVGTFYYYVVVTNTNDKANGVKTANVTSDTAEIIVNANPQPAITNAETPTITIQPISANYTLGDTFAPLSVTATVTDGGTLSYQWYMNTTNGAFPISGPSSTFTPSLSTVGRTYYYYVVITNTNDNVNGSKTASITSNTAQIITNKFVDAAVPIITVQPQSANYILGDTIATLSVTANITDGGTLSYQWYENTTSGVTPILGETSSTFTPTISTVGTTYYYYVVITNTNDNVSGDKTAIAKSNTAQIVVNFPTYSINFYDDNLDFLKTINVIKNTTINLLTTYPSPTNFWYKANETTDTTQLNATNNINLYVIPNVQEITTQEELDNIRNNLKNKYILLNNITLDENKAGFDNTTNEGWIPIGSYKPYPETLSFRGIFNGNNNTITNLWINRPTTHGVGLFGFIEYAQIRNLGVETAEGKEIKGDYYVGGIVGEIIGGYIINSYSNGNISGNSSVGGIAGAIAIGSITNSYSMGNINGNERIGGIAGDVYENSDIINSYSNGSISGNNSVGGIAGYASQSDITNSHSVGHVSGDKRVGGIVGFIMNNRDITNSYSAGNISGNRGVGGIAGDVMSNRNIANSYSTGNISGNSEVGGIAGRFGDGNITNSYSTGDISGNESIGGIAGDIATGNIANSYSTGNISGDDMVGGIAGYLYYSSAQNNAAINPSVTGTSNVNRVIGYIDTTYGPITISNNFALYTMSGGISGSFDHSNINRYGISKSDIDLKFQITYSDTVNGNGFGGLGWKFGDDDDNPWVQDAFSDYPYPTLYWQK